MKWPEQLLDLPVDQGGGFYNGSLRKEAKLEKYSCSEYWLGQTQQRLAREGRPPVRYNLFIL